VEWLTKLLQNLGGYAIRWRTRGGFFRITATLCLGTWELQRLQELPAKFLLVAEPTVAIGWLFCWLIGSGRFLIPRRGKTIVFAIDLEVEAERNFGRIFQSLRAALSDLELAQPLTLKRIGPDIVRDTKDANSYVKNHAVSQVIWGRALAGKANNEQIQKLEVYWLWRLPGDKNVDPEAVLADLKLLERGKKWTIEEVNELVDIEIVAEDFLEMSLAILAILSLIDGKLDDAAVLFRRVVSGLQTHSGSDRSKIDRFQSILDTAEFSIAARAHETGEHAKAVRILERLLPRYPADFDYRTTLARAYFLAGDTDAAKRCTAELAKLDPGSPVVYVNYAFFCILEGKYKTAGNWYEKLSRSRRDKLEVLTSVSEFLEAEYDAAPNEHAYLYGLAIVNGLIDPTVLHSDLRRFLEVTDDRREYLPLRTRALAVLRQLRQ